MNLIKVTNTKNKIVVNKTDNTIKVFQTPNKIIVKNVGIQGAKGDDNIVSINELDAHDQFIEIGTDGNDINIVSAVDTHTVNIPTASATKRGALDSADYTTFNNKASTDYVDDSIDNAIIDAGTF